MLAGQGRALLMSKLPRFARGKIYRPMSKNGLNFTPGYARTLAETTGGVTGQMAGAVAPAAGHRMP